MKKITLTILLFFLIINLFSQTYINGAITSDEIWTSSNSPYIITDNTIIMDNVTLTIEQGVDIKFEDNIILQINGELKAIGTIENMITFTANSDNSYAGQWGYIKFAPSSDKAIFDVNNNYINGSILKYCIVQYTGSYPGYGAIYIDKASPYIDNCIIKDNLYSGIEFHSERDDITQIISNNEIYNNHESGVKFYSSSGDITFPNYSIFIINNNIYNNDSETGGGIYVYTYEFSYDDAYLNISENFIVNNNASYRGGGIYLESQHNVMSEILIDNNLIVNNYSPSDNGIFYNFSNDVEFIFTIENNSILNYNNNNSFLINGSFHAHSSTTSVAAFFHINNNTLWSPNLETNGILYNLTGNNIPNGFINFNNLFCSDNVYSIYNGSELNINSQNNYFYSLDFDNIIYDWFDAPELGIVDYSSNLSLPNNSSPISPPIEITKINEGGGVLVSWQENLETDLAGYRIYYNKINNLNFDDYIDVGNVNSFVMSEISINDTIAITAYDNLADGQNDMVEGHESFFSYSDIEPTIINTTLVNKNSIYPNPTNGILHIKTQKQIKKITIIDINGKIIIETKSAEIDLSNQKAGIYIVKVDTKEQIFIDKIVIE